METNNMLKLLRKAFETESIKENKGIGFGKNSSVKFHISEEDFMKVANDFPFIKNAVKAGLIKADKSKREFIITSEALQVRSSDKRKKLRKQFFSVHGDDKLERTTLHDAIVTIDNVRKVANKFSLSPSQLNFTIRHENGDPNKVINFVDVDASVFGRNEDEVKKNVEKINNVVQFKRNSLDG